MSCGKIFLIFLGIILAGLIAFGGWFWYELKMPVTKTDERQNFIIERGESASDIANKLAQKKLIRSAFVFKIYGMFSDDSSNILDGEFEIHKNMNIPQILSYITSAKNKIEFKITIIEGWRLTEIAAEVEKKNIGTATDFMKLVGQDSPFREQYDFLKDIPKTAPLEGFLFPDTYIYNSETKMEDLVTQMLDNFDEKVIQASASDINSNAKAIYDVIKMASIIEREAKKDSDRPIIASVYYNRLKLNMKLQADPTIQYAKGDWKQITASDYGLRSVFNTYMIDGLPPGPICNPGTASVKAALHPANTEYLFFFNLKDGSAIYSKTAEEHAQMLSLYQDKR